MLSTTYFIDKLTEMVCPSNYNDLLSGSDYCYRIVTNQETWETAKGKCQQDGGELACFSNQQERDDMADQCDQCWVGYTWQNGILRYYDSMLLLNR